MVCCGCEWAVTAPILGCKSHEMSCEGSTLRRVKSGEIRDAATDRATGTSSGQSGLGGGGGGGMIFSDTKKKLQLPF